MATRTIRKPSPSLQRYERWFVTANFFIWAFEQSNLSSKTLKQVGQFLDSRELNISHELHYFCVACGSDIDCKLITLQLNLYDKQTSFLKNVFFLFSFLRTCFSSSFKVMCNVFMAPQCSASLLSHSGTESRMFSVWPFNVSNVEKGEMFSGLWFCI